MHISSPHWCENNKRRKEITRFCREIWPKFYFLQDLNTHKLGLKISYQSGVHKKRKEVKHTPSYIDLPTNFKTIPPLLLRLNSRKCSQFYASRTKGTHETKIHTAKQGALHLTEGQNKQRSCKYCERKSSWNLITRWWLVL